MNKNLLAAAVCSVSAIGSGPAGAAPAVTLNPLGTGQVLLFPYYTVNGGNDTYLSVVNTTNRGKAVRIRFLEGRNSKDVLDFNIYLSPYDVWSAATISLDPNGPANLLTRDRSCTVPDIVGNTALPVLGDGTRYVAFRNFQYAASAPDNGGTSLSRTREGHLEIIEMGVLSPGSAPTQVAEEVTHQSASGSPNSGIPSNCAQIVSNWLSTGGGWGDAQTGNRQLDIGLPNGGLYGEAVIINVVNGTLHAYSADAIDGFYGGSAAPGGLHFAPGSVRPTLADASNGGATVDSLVTTAGGESVRSTWNAGTLPDAVSAVLMQDAIYNEFNTESALAAQSEWVITFPTKGYYVNNNGLAPRRPFTTEFRDSGKACEPARHDTWDREEGRSNPEWCNGFDPEFCGPIPPTHISQGLCYSVTVQSFNQTPVGSGGATAIFGATQASNVEVRSNGPGGGSSLPVDRGQMRIVFGVNYASADDGSSAETVNRMTSVDGDVYKGLPVTGFWSANYVNSGAQPGKLANYSGAIRHRGTRSIVGS